MKKKKHICDKMNIIWNKKPIPSDNDIEWHGICRECKRKVFEVYYQSDELYDLETEKEIN